MENIKCALVTGSNRGIGNAILRALAQAGYQVIAHARKETPEFADTIRAVASETGSTIRPVYFDMTDTETMKKEIKAILKQKNQIDILVNNAGVAHGSLFQMTSMQTVRDVFDVNFFSYLELTQLLLRPMVKRGNGCIINLASVSGMDSKAGNCAYGTSKAAVIAWTRTLAAEVGKLGVRVNAIAPSLADTDMAKQIEEQAGIDMLRDSAMNRLATPEEIANVALFLASGKASFVNGQVIRVDGGIA